jgi:hypothetical protein
VISKNTQTQRKAFSKIWEVTEVLEISAIIEFLRNNGGFGDITSKISEIFVISFFGSLNTAESLTDLLLPK